VGNALDQGILQTDQNKMHSPAVKKNLLRDQLSSCMYV
jgi:hypothetical protein